jgi:TolB-like protein/DNA-binding winged helix-turn-helix (wHTH) protein
MEATVRTRRTRFGAFDVDLRSGEVYKHGIRLKLQDQPFRVLALLLEHSGDVVTREELHQKLWPADTFVDFDTGLNSAIKKLRDVLGDSAEEPRYIETLPRRGYRFIAPVESVLATLPLAASKLTALGIQINDNVIQPAEISESESSDGTSSSIVSHSTVEFVPPSPIEAFPHPLRTVAETRRQKMRAGLALGITLAALALCATLLVRPRWASDKVPAPIRSVAVLPLENLTGDPSQEYFADGMTDALITDLAQVRGLTVISRTSVTHYKGTRKTLPEIARELGVDAVVEGTVEHSGDEVKITAQLIRASTDTHLWAASYARVWQDVLRLQADVARDVTQQISDQLVPVDNKAGSEATFNLEAYDAYLKGVYFLDKANPDGARTAIRYFQGAVGKDRNFAAAYSRLADCYAFLSATSEMPSAEANAAAKEAAQKAVALDGNLAQAHTVLAWIAQWDWDWTRAETEYKRAIQLNPNSADAHMGYSYLLLTLGESEKSAQEEQAADVLDPLSVQTLIGTISNLYYRRQYDDGLIRARTAIRLYPQISAFHVLLSNFYTAQRKDKLSVEEILTAEETGGAPLERLAALRAANKTAGPMGLRRKRIELNIKQAGKTSINAYDIAIDYAVAGDKDQALVWLERALQARDSKITVIAVEPIFDNLRSDPRFVGLLRQMGLNPTHS